MKNTKILYVYVYIYIFKLSLSVSQSRTTPSFLLVLVNIRSFASVKCQDSCYCCLFLYFSSCFELKLLGYHWMNNPFTIKIATYHFPKYLDNFQPTFHLQDAQLTNKPVRLSTQTLLSLRRS